jgi:hypothetical protein
MRLNNRTILRLVMLGLCAAGSTTRAADATSDKAAAAVDAEFGAKIKAAQASFTEEDNLAVARQLLEASKAETKDVARAAALAERAMAIGGKMYAGSGDEVATGAARRLMELKPDRKLELLDTISTMRQKRFNNASKAADKTHWGDATILSMLESAEAHMYAELFADAYDRHKQATRVATNYKCLLGAKIAVATEFCKNREQLMSEVRGLEQKMRTPPVDPAAAQRLVFLHLIELNDPAAAAAFAPLTKDPRVIKLAPLATRTDKDLAPADALALADWLRELSAKAGKLALPPIVLRSHRLYERYLEAQKVQDATRQNALQSLREVEKTMAAHGIEPPTEAPKVAKATPKGDPLGRVTETGGGNALSTALQAPLDMRKNADNPSVWVDCLKIIHPSIHQLVGEWKKTDKQFVQGSFTVHNSHLWIPLRLTGSYEFQVGFLPVQGDGTLQFSLPVGANRASLLLSTTHPDLSGLESVDGKTTVESNTLVKPFAVKAGQEHTIRIGVRIKGETAEIDAVINNVPLVKWNGLAASLTAPTKWRVNEAGCPSIGVDPTGADAFDVVFNHVKLRVLDGVAETVNK